MYRSPYVSPYTPPGAIVEHAMMNTTQLHRYVPYSEEPQYVPTVHMQSRLERFAVGEMLSFRLGTPYTVMQDDLRGCGEYLKRNMVERLADIGLLIPDSVRVDVEEDYLVGRELPLDHPDRKKEYRYYKIVCRANALMPTYEGEKEPRRHYCEHCTSTAFEDQYHSGTCENCGAPFKRGTFHGSGV